MSIHCAETPYGFEWGAAKIERGFSDARGWVTLLVTTKKYPRGIQVYITKSGKVRVFYDGEWIQQPRAASSEQREGRRGVKDEYARYATSFGTVVVVRRWLNLATITAHHAPEIVVLNVPMCLTLDDASELVAALTQAVEQAEAWEREQPEGGREGQ